MRPQAIDGEPSRLFHKPYLHLLTQQTEQPCVTCYNSQTQESKTQQKKKKKTLGATENSQFTSNNGKVRHTTHKRNAFKSRRRWAKTPSQITGGPSARLHNFLDDSRLKYNTQYKHVVNVGAQARSNFPLIPIHLMDSTCSKLRSASLGYSVQNAGMENGSLDGLQDASVLGTSHYCAMHLISLRNVQLTDTLFDWPADIMIRVAEHWKCA